MAHIRGGGGEGSAEAREVERRSCKGSCGLEMQDISISPIARGRKFVNLWLVLDASQP